MMGYEDVADKLMRSDVLRQTTWNRDTLATWLRDGFRCVYCGYDLLPSYDMMYYYSCRDHLLPASKYPELRNTGWNLVLSCKACNAFKLSWDPNKDRLYTPSSLIISEESRAELLRRAKEYIGTKREARLALFREEHALISAELEELTLRKHVTAQG